MTLVPDKAQADKPAEEDRILLGRITGVHGIRGDVLVHSYAASAEDIASYGALSDAAGTRAFKLKIVGSTSKGLIARVSVSAPGQAPTRWAAVTDRTAAEALRGTELYVDRAKLPPAGEGEFYHADLIGLVAVAPDGTALGEVVGVENYGAGDLIELRLTAKKQTELVPFTDACVPEVDLERRRIVVVMPVAVEGDGEGRED